MRLRQEIVLCVGGVRLLKALNIPAVVFHANEGHSSFLFLERIRGLVEAGKSFEDACKEIAESSVFTTHTPVAAGHDVFDEEMISAYFKEYWQSFGLDREKFLELGRASGRPGWNMTALALKLSGRRNGVSRRHGEVSRHMWAELWPDAKGAEMIGHVTNGVHLSTWVQQELTWVFERYIGATWFKNPDDPAVWSKLAAVPDEELWRVHMRCKEDMLKIFRNRARRRWMVDSIDPAQVLAHGALLDSSALTIGFARRFAGYKRATLILRDLERLKALLLDTWHPVQIIFAGKAHPDDDGGKALIQQIYRLARDPAFGGRIAFVEDYDMHVARYLVHGCDLWLNNPQPPLEACGTSGQKAAVNGVPNCSVLDGWWEEGYNGSNGWAFGPKPGESASDADDAAGLYDLLEKVIVPLFYERHHGVPHGWVRVMKESIRSVAPRFCGERMLKEYVDRLYIPGVAAGVPR